MPSTKPKLAQLQTPMSATFPSELNAFSAKTPLSAFPSAMTPLSAFPLDYIKQEDIKTPITPPLAYTDFLKTMASPVLPSEKSSGRTTPTSAPSTGSSEHSDCSCACETHKSPTTTVVPALPTSASFIVPSSARSTSWLGRLRIPPSPSFSECESPLSAPLTASSAVRSPYSARSAKSTRSPYDWESASKNRYLDIKSPRTTTKSVREVREIVTRTVTYTSTPRMSPAPKGKRRKIE
ncbi:hypothetical protein BJ878DRAFT_172057 [Calycina marina]|uniref:Uncharacterized protein n=1 Tax=Calycina marina TaxID=1763456 RepID=A0A9P7Z8X6_9HELO|nr:hypothetical protein BJ878DRAFT_172057 [Calycina marina]